MTGSRIYIAPPRAGVTAEPTQRLLRYIADAKVSGVTVYRIRQVDIENPRVLGALRARGIEGLPAMIAGGRAYVGAAEIQRGLASARREGPGAHANGREYDRESEYEHDREREGGRESEREREGEGADGGYADEEAAEQLEAFFQSELRPGRPDSEMGFGR